jgi:hypothetical protein
VDSLGVRQVLRFQRIAYAGSRPAGGGADVAAPAAFELRAARERDTVRLRVSVTDAQATRMGAMGVQRYFIQMRGLWLLDGRIAGEVLSDSGSGFFETFVRR